MTPTMVTKDGKVVLILGSPGGSTIITTVANDLISVLVNGLSVQAAADAPRFHHQWMPDRLDVEKAFPDPRRRCDAGDGLYGLAGERSG